MGDKLTKAVPHTYYKKKFRNAYTGQGGPPAYIFPKEPRQNGLSGPQNVKFAFIMSKKKSSHNLVWMDLEMSGLEPEKDVVLEIATIVTNAELEILAEGPVIAIHQPENVFEGMDEWNTRHHNQSGLVERCRHSQYSLADAEQETLRFIKQFTEKGKNVLCGNSITQDRRFLYKYMPEISEWLCYRNIDVSSIKELTYRWYPKLEEFQKEKRHEALNDIRESIAELAYYRKTIFK